MASYPFGRLRARTRGYKILQRRANVMTQHVGEHNPPYRLMLTPGPSTMDPRGNRAMSTPLVRHLDPRFKGCIDDPELPQRQIFQTENRLTMPLSASGS